MSDAPKIAVFCDYENVALGAKDAKYGDFRIDLVLERLLDKGQIVVKKAYCDWGRYQSAKKSLHEASFELIEIPHVRISGKNSADIRMVVDALDLCYTKPHVGLFGLITGDSDFSPLVSKLRENGKIVIGVGVKSSSSDLLVENCDEFIFYDDLVRRTRKRSTRKGDKTQRDKSTRGDPEEAVQLVVDVVESLLQEHGDHFFGSLVKQTLKRKRPHFAESYYGYRSFSELLEDAAKSGQIQIERDEKSGGYVIIGLGT